MLLRHCMLYLLARGLPGVINFLAIVIYTRLLFPEDYGRYALVVAGVGFFNVVFFGWLGLSLARFLPAHVKEPRPLLGTILVSYLGVVLFTGGLGFLIALLGSDCTWRKLIFLGVLLLWVQAWFELNLELFRSKLQPLRYGLTSGIKAVSALVLGAVLAFLGFGAYGPLIGLMAGMLLAGLGLNIREWQGIQPKFFRPILKQILRYGLPLTATFALSFVVNTSDRFLIAWFLGEGPAGVYAAAYDLGQQTLTLLMTVVNLAAYPLAVRALEQQGIGAAQQQLRQNAILLLTLAIPAAVGLAVLSPNVVGVLLGESFRKDATYILPWVALSVLLAGVRAYHFDLAFQLGRFTLGQVWVVGAAAFLNLVLNLWWIPFFGLRGAAYATFVAYFLALLLSVFLGRRVLQVPFPFYDGLKVTLASLLMGGILLFTLKYKGIYALVAQVGGGALVYTVLVGLLDIGGYRSKLLRRILT